MNSEKKDYLTEKKNDIKKFTLKEKIFNVWVIFRQREGRGSGFIAHFWGYLQKGAMISIMSEALNIHIPGKVYIPLGIAYLVGAYILGWADEKYFKLWQFEMEKSQTRIHPYWIRLEKKVNKLIKKVNLLGKKS